MYKNKKVAVVVPTYNEEAQVGKVIESMPAFVDKIIIVNDCSRDGTAEVVQNYIQDDSGRGIEIKKALEEIVPNNYNQADIIAREMVSRELRRFLPSRVININPESDRIILINNLKNGGVGASIARGYKWSLDHRIDCTAVMAGDGQMDPGELESIIDPVISEGVDYVKGNRLIHRSAWLVIPRVRYFGNSILSILTKIASGYWRVSDTQCGYTAISMKALQAIRLYDIYRR